MIVGQKTMRQDDPLDSTESACTGMRIIDFCLLFNAGTLTRRLQ